MALSEYMNFNDSCSLLSNCCSTAVWGRYFFTLANYRKHVAKAKKMKEDFILKWSYITHRIVLFGVHTMYVIHIWFSYLFGHIYRYFEIFFFCKIKVIRLQWRFTWSCKCQTFFKLQKDKKLNVLFTCDFQLTWSLPLK